MGPISPLWEKGDRPKKIIGRREKLGRKFREKGERQIILGEGRRGLK